MGKISPVSRTVHDYSESATVHGVSYVFSKPLPLLDRVIWGLVTLSCLSLAIYWSVIAYGNWQDNLVVTSLKDPAKPVAGLSFPAVTICTSGLDMEAVKDKLLQDFDKWKTMEGKTSLDKEEDKTHLREYMKMTFEIEDFGGKNIFDILKALSSPDPGSTMSSLSLLDKAIACSKQSKQESKTTNRKIRSTSGQLFPFQYEGHVYARIAVASGLRMTRDVVAQTCTENGMRPFCRYSDRNEWAEECALGNLPQEWEGKSSVENIYTLILMKCNGEHWTCPELYDIFFHVKDKLQSFSDDDAGQNFVSAKYGSLGVVSGNGGWNVQGVKYISTQDHPLYAACVQESVLLMDGTSYQVKALGVLPGLEMTSATLLSTCTDGGMIPVCALDSPSEDCFEPPNGIRPFMEDSECGSTKFWATPACFFLDYVFAYRKDGVPKIVKAENSTDNPDHILWQNVGGSVGLSGQKGKNFYALCQYVLPTTTTTTTTTTEAPTTLSSQEMERFLTNSDCPLTQTAGSQTDSSFEPKLGLPHIDLYLNPERKGELDELKAWIERNEANLTYSEDTMSRIYPNIFKLLWQAMLPCSPTMNNPDLPHMIRSCSWLGNQVNCSDIFTQIVTDSGVCCAFNVHDNLKESEYSRLVREMRKTESGDDGQVEEVYHKSGKSSLPDYIKNIGSPQRNKHFDSLIKLPSQVGQTTYNAWDQDIATLNIFFGQETVMELERGISMGPVEFVSSLGGLFGLFLGFSVISFLEIVYWATLRMCRNFIWKHDAGEFVE